MPSRSGLLHPFYGLRARIALWRNRRFWKQYYREHSEPDPPSSFACYCMEHYLHPGCSLLELGCGNGRDALFFGRHGLQVLALDLCRSEILHLQTHHGNVCAGGGRVDFRCHDFTTYRSPHPFDAVYSRFTLHSISAGAESAALSSARANLRYGGLLLIEARSRHDPLREASVLLSEREGVTDHYRRFLDIRELSASLTALGFELLLELEGRGLAVHGTEDPLCLRIVARRCSDRR